MGKPYSDDLRERVVAAIEAGHTRAKVAESYNMAWSTVGGFIKRKRETGTVSPDKFGGYKTFALEPHTALVKELVADFTSRGLNTNCLTSCDIAGPCVIAILKRQRRGALSPGRLRKGDSPRGSADNASSGH